MSHNPYRDESYFWYSQEQSDCRNQQGDDAMRYALIDGKEVLYTTLGRRDNEGPKWDDTYFLGRGKIARIVR